MAVDAALFLPPTADQNRALPEPIWRGPLVPIALAATAGIMLDRLLGVPLLWTILTATAGVVGCACFILRHRPLPALAMLWLTTMALGGAYHHWRRDVFPADDVGQYVTEEPRPILLRGIVDTEPLVIKRGGNDELRSFAAKDGGRLILQATDIKQEHGWRSASGRMQVHLGLPPVDLHVGDEVEVSGRIELPSPPANPGEFDYAAQLRDQRIRAVMSVKDAGDNVRILRQGSGLSLERGLAQVRAWGQRVLTDYLPEERQGVAIALLLGDGAPMTQDDWDKYIRTGVIHVLAISGQHLVVLAAFLALGLRLLRVRLRQAVVITALFLLGYSLLVGGRPPVMRSAVAVCCVCGGLLARRPLVRANIFALAWLVVALLNPTDLFNMGCQLSFLAVAVLTWGTSGWIQRDADAMDQLAASARPLWQQGSWWLGRQVLLSYAVTLAIWVVVAPLVAARQNVLSLAGLVIGPPTVLLTSIALLSVFALLFFAPILPPLAHVAAWVTQWSLAGCDELVGWTANLPGACWYVPTIPTWWLWLFYPAVLGLLWLQTLRRLWSWCALGVMVLFTVGLVSGAARPRTDELRCTFLAVGHGGCVVLETPDGKTILYDVGSLRGPEVVRRQVAPFLWQRGFRRIDEVFLSHADLDHFNGLVSLMDRFAVGQVSCTPSFQDRPTPAVRKTMEELRRRGVPVRVLSVGQRLHAGDVNMEVLHPPAIGPEGNENSRSLVLLVRHAGHTILLTGDLEGAGLAQVTARVPPRVDVLMAPHHGNRIATAGMTQWVSPRAVVSCQEAPRSLPKKDARAADGPPLLGTWPHGAITIRSGVESLVVETFVSKQRWQMQ
ncbi:MAG TPA: ComEC/Rec2 family competence protein [Gemmataceae bacterium]|nr:ComEC/Rec2 family competence protein [Gemmataceae bacterium]